MIRSLILAAAFCAVSSQASAAWLTQYASIQMGGGAPDTTFVQYITATGGYTFTNTISDTTGGVNPGDTRRIVTVGSMSLADTYYRSTFTAPGSVPSYFDGNPVVAVFALEGTATTGIGGAGDAKALFDTGRVAFFANTPTGGNYFPNDPLTWGATTGDGTSLLTPIAVWDLAPPAATMPGTQDGIPDPAVNFTYTEDEMNVSAINTVAGGDLQGRFLFMESQTYTGSTEVGNDFITITGPDYAGGAQEGIIAYTDQQVAVAPSPFLYDDGLAALNTIAQQLGGLDFFATGFGAGATDYNMGSYDPAVTGDLQAVLEGRLAPVAVPEPASIAVFSLIGLAAVPMIRRRRKMAVAKA